MTRLEPVPVEVMVPLELILVTVKPPPLIAPEVLKPAAVMLLVAVIDLETFKLPAKELEFAPVEMNWAKVVTLPVA